MALNGDLGIFYATANGRAVEPGCRDMDIFLLCGSPGRTNGHLCFGVLALVSGSADGGTTVPEPIATVTLCNDRCMVTDHDALCRASRLRTIAAADGSAIAGGCLHLGMPPDDDVFCISSIAAAANACGTPAAFCVNSCIALDDDVFCISRLCISIDAAAANACATPAACCVNRCIALNDDVFCAFGNVSPDACRSVPTCTFCGQAAGGV